MLLVRILLTFLVLSNISLCHTKKILAVEFFGSKSHVFTYLPLLEELSRRGHEVTLVSPVQNIAKAGVREIYSVDLQLLMKTSNLSIFEMKGNNEDLNPFPFLKQMIPEACRALYDQEDIKALLEVPFDLIILQPLFNECSLGFVHAIMQKHKAKLILFSTTTAPSFMVGYTGGHHPPSFVPSILSGFRDEMTFWERVQNYLLEATIYATYLYYFMPAMEEVYYQKMGTDYPNAREILSSASIILANGHFSINKPKPNLPDVIDVGGLHSRPGKPLPKDLEDFIAKGKDGFILFSLGTAVRGDEMPQNKRDMFVNVFAKLKQQVIWKFESEHLPNLPKNVKLSKWLPQQDLLGHPQIKTFITHCGGGGIEESIYNGVPLVGIPFLGDQPLNAKEAANNGFLIQLEWNDLTEEVLLKSLNEILNNPKYKQNAQELSAVFIDQINTPLERGVWWTEYVMRHKGAPRIQSIAARKLNFFQYHSFDVIAFLVGTIGVFIYFIVKGLALVCKKLCRKNKQISQKVNGKSE